MGLGSFLGFLFCEKAALVGAVEMWESRQRFPRAVDNEGNRCLVFLVVHGPAFPQRGVPFFHALRLRILIHNWRLASCRLRAASVSVCAAARSSSAATLSPGRRNP